MTDRPQVLSSAEAFRHWLMRNSRNSDDRWYVRRVNRALIVHSKRRLQGFHPYMDGPLVSIALPQVRHAKEWWRRLWIAELVDVRLRDNPVLPVVLMSKAAVWDALPQLHLDWPKSSFAVISEEMLRRIVGNDVAKEMFLEVGAAGISVRRLTPVHARRAGVNAGQSRNVNRRRKSEMIR